MSICLYKSRLKPSNLKASRNTIFKNITLACKDRTCQFFKPRRNKNCLDLKSFVVVPCLQFHRMRKSKVSTIFQVLVLGNAFTLEQRLQLADHQVQGSSSMHNLLVHNKGESMMLNLVLPLCLKIGCGNKDDPKLRKTDIRFVLNLLLNMINPHKKGRSTNYEVNNANNGASLGANLAVGGAPSNRSSSVQYNPSGDARTRIKTSSLEIAFLGKFPDTEIYLIYKHKNIDEIVRF